MRPYPVLKAIDTAFGTGTKGEVRHFEIKEEDFKVVRI